VSSPIEEHFTHRFLNLYGAPNVVDPAAFKAEYVRALAGTEPTLLKAASDRVVDGHTFRNWPTVGECVAAIKAVAAERAAHARTIAAAQPPEPRAEPAPEMRARVDVLLRQTRANLKVIEADHLDHPYKGLSKPDFERMQARSPNGHLHRQRGTS
jgi:hypothetical protein